MPDKRHPSLAGTYLAAATSHGALFKRSPVGLSYTAGLDPAVAPHLQTVAWETVGLLRALAGSPCTGRDSRAPRV